MSQRNPLDFLFDTSVGSGSSKLDELLGIRPITEEERAARRARIDELEGIARGEALPTGSIPSLSKDAKERAAQLAPIYQEVSAKYGVPYDLLMAQAHAESQFNPAAVSPRGAVGTAQFMPDTAKRFGLTNPSDPVASAHAQAKYMRNLLDMFGGDPSLALAGYNAGEGNVKKFGGIPHFKETRDYVAKVNQLRGLYGGQGGAPAGMLDVSSPNSPAAQYLAPSEQSAQPSMMPVLLSTGETINVDPNHTLEDVARILKENGEDAVPMRGFQTPQGEVINVPYTMGDEDIIHTLRRDAPELTVAKGEPVPDYTGYLAAAKGALKGSLGQLGLGGAELAKAAGFPEAAKTAEEWARKQQKEGQAAFEMPTEEQAGVLKRKVGIPLAQGVAGLAPILPAMAIPGAGGLAAAAGLMGTQELGALKERAEAEKKPFELKEAAPYAAAVGAVNLLPWGRIAPLFKAASEDAVLGSREAIRAIVENEGVEAAQQKIGSYVGQALKNAGLAEAAGASADIATSVLERAYTDQKLWDKNAFDEYKDVLAQGAPFYAITGAGAGVAGRHIKATELEKIKEQQALEPMLEAQKAAEETRAATAAQKAEEAAAKQTIEIPQDLKDAGLSYNEALSVMQAEGRLPEAPEPEAPEPEVPAGKPYYESLGLSKRQKLIRNALTDLDPANPEHAQAIETVLSHIEENDIPHKPAAIRALRTQLEEVKNAEQIQKTGPLYGDGGPRPETGEGIGNLPEGGEGVREGGPEISQETPRAQKAPTLDRLLSAEDIADTEYVALLNKERNIAAERVARGENPLTETHQRQIESNLHHAESSEALAIKQLAKETPNMEYAAARWREAQGLREASADYYRRFTGYEPPGTWGKARPAPWETQHAQTPQITTPPVRTPAVQTPRAPITDLVKDVQDKSLPEKLSQLGRDVFTSGKDLSVTSEWFDKDAPIAKAVGALPSLVDDRLRADLGASHYAQVGNVMADVAHNGYPILNKDGTLESVKDDNLAFQKIMQRVHENGIDRQFREMLISERGADIKEADEKMRRQAATLEAHADTIEQAAKALKNKTEAKRLMANAKSIREKAETLLDRVGEGRTGVTEEQIAAGKTFKESNAVAQREAGNVRDLLRKIVDMAHDSGLLSAQQAKEFNEAPHYFPLYKAADDEARMTEPLNFVKEAVSGMGRGSKTLPEVKRQKEHFHSVLAEDNMLRHIAFFTRAVAENEKRKSVAKQMELLGAAEPSKIREKDPYAVMFKENGEEKYYTIKDKDAWYALQAAAPLLNPIFKPLKNVSSLVRGAMVMNPLFWFRQVVREPLTASLVARTGVVTPFDTMHEIGRIMANKSAWYEKLKRTGVVSAQDVITDPVEFVKAAQKKRGFVANGVEYVKKVHEAVDGATRAVVAERAYKQALSEGKTPEQATTIAVSKAREIINFAKQGRNEIARTMRVTTPFFGAALNGLHVMAKAMSPEKIGKLSKAEAMEARRIFYSRAALIALYSTAYALAMSDDEDYLKSPDRANNWLIPTGDKDAPFVKIAIPFELGFFVKTLPEQLALMNMGAISTKRGTGDIKKAAADTLLPPMPTIYAVKPLVEAYINYDFHNLAPIESGSDANKVSYMRDNKAGEITKAIARELHSMGINLETLSPDRMEHILKGYLGQMWAVSRAASDYVMYNGPAKPDKMLADYPLLSGVLAKGTGDQAVNDFYSIWKDISDFAATESSARTHGDVDTLTVLQKDKDFQKMMQAHEPLKEIMDNMNTARANIERVELLRDISAEEKTKRITKLKEDRNRLANRGVRLARQLGFDI